mmetsp:Transcript_14403/g.35756  ORF Transcript_14403/g.35756 Transcript_14403/m.35756 type:complete len:206 (-) Transcript_14403:10-627(-)
MTGSVMVNAVPRPSSLSQTIVPSCADTSCLTILRPSPVPPYFLVTLISTCSNAPQMAGIFAFGIPMPVSSTRTMTLVPCASAGATYTPTWPLCVNLRLLPNRLYRIWTIREKSPMTRGVRGSILRTMETSFLARGDTISTTCSTALASDTTSCFTVSLPSLSAATSRMSLMMLSRWLEEFLMVRMNCCPLGFISPPEPLHSASDS